MIDWKQRIDRFEDWWRQDNRGLPLMHVVARAQDTPAPAPPERAEDLYLDSGYLLARMGHSLATKAYLADAFPVLDVNLGPGSMALYLGGRPRFMPQTVWYEPCMEDIVSPPAFAYDEENVWWKRHQALVRRCAGEAKDDYIVSIPDIIENIDILAALRGPEALLLDLMDEPEAVLARLEEIQSLFFRYYDRMYDLVKRPDGSSCYTAFSIIGKGRVAKVQCDFSAMISPRQFRDFVMPTMEKQLQALDHAVYHLDGPDAIRHVPALMELEGLQALQWTCGAGQPDGGDERWYPIYDQVRAAGKSLWIAIGDGELKDWLDKVDRLMDRYGGKALYLLFPVMPQKDADALMDHAHRRWKI